MAADPPDIADASRDDILLAFNVAQSLGVAMYGGFVKAILAGIYAERERVREQVTAGAEQERPEYALRLDCAVNGCDPVHDDNGELFPRKGITPPLTRTVNGHAVTVVERIAAYTPWTPVALDDPFDLAAAEARTEDPA